MVIKIDELATKRLGISDRITELETLISKWENTIEEATVQADIKINSLTKQLNDLQKTFNSRKNTKKNLKNKQLVNQLKLQITNELNALNEMANTLRDLKEERDLLAKASDDITNQILYYRNSVLFKNNFYGELTYCLY